MIIFYKEKNFTVKKNLLSQNKFEKDIVFNPKNEKSYLYLAKYLKNENDTLEEQNLNTVILLTQLMKKLISFNIASD